MLRAAIDIDFAVIVVVTLISSLHPNGYSEILITWQSRQPE